MALKRKKLYFDVQISSASLRTAVLCTQLTAGTTGDRHDALLTYIPTIAASAPANVRAAKEARARFMCVSMQGGDGSGGPSALRLDFIPPTGSITAAAGVTSAVGLGHFRVRLAREDGSGTVNGVLVVERQHSVEV